MIVNTLCTHYLKEHNETWHCSGKSLLTETFNTSPTTALNTKIMFDVFETVSIAMICDIKSIDLVYLNVQYILYYKVNLDL